MQRARAQWPRWQGRRNPQWLVKCVAKGRFESRTSLNQKGEMSVQRKRHSTDNLQLLCKVLVSMCCQHRAEAKGTETEGTTPLAATNQKLKDVRSPLYASPPHEDSQPERVSMSSTVSDHDHDDYDSPVWKDKEESSFILFLEQLNSIQFDLPA
jgi:hypothetical protein